MSAGRELDALIAVKVMGWSSAGERQMWSIPEDPYVGEPEPDGTAWMGQLPPERRTHSEQHIHLPHYSTDIADAWQVVEKLYEGRWYFSLELTSDSTWVAKIGALPSVEEATAPLAICRAALAIGGRP